ncbi:MAG: 23S rRNA (adenine(2030)-N(6))-methyltransferase RlmJ, partial [Paracoccaceae bacterium]
LAELHPKEFAALDWVMASFPARCYQQNGFDMALSVAPPVPRRGLMLIDPSYEIKSDYDTIPGFIARVHRKWNVGVVVLWYPILSNGLHKGMLGALTAQTLPKVLHHEVRFAPARPGHGMIGSGLFIVNGPYGVEAQAEHLSRVIS